MRSEHFLGFSLPNMSRNLGEILVKFSAVYVFQGLGVRSGNISPKFHAINGVKNRDHFVQVSLCWGVALNFIFYFTLFLPS